MDRSFFRRVETAFPIVDPDIKKRLIADLDCYLNDNTQAWELKSDGSYSRSRPLSDEDATSAQGELIAALADLA
jgi:polyphosphate kinase